MKYAHGVVSVTALLVLHCAAVQPRTRLAINIPAKAVVGEVFHVSVTVSRKIAPQDQQRAHVFVTVTSGNCEITFLPQRFDQIGDGHSRTTRNAGSELWLPVTVSSQQLEDGKARITGHYQIGSLAISSNPKLIEIVPPDPEVVNRHVQRLKECSEPSACLREIEYFKYVSSKLAADRLASLLPEYAHIPEAGDAVFIQQRRIDTSVLRRAAEAPNADSQRLRELARRLEAGISCPGE